jgi:hypothetical protein
MTPKPKDPHGGGGDDGGGGTSHRKGTPEGAPHVEHVRAAQDSATDLANRGTPGSVEGRQPGTPNPANPGAKTFVDNIVSDPKSVVGKSAQDIAKEFNDAGYQATVEQSTKKGTSGNAVQVRISGHPEIQNIQVHPGGGRHTPAGSPYWKISTSTGGKTWVVPNDFSGSGELRGKVVPYE